MKVLHSIISWFFKQRINQIRQMIDQPMDAQNKVFDYLLKKGRQTTFGRDHGFIDAKSIQAFQEQVPIRNYEALFPYIQRIMEGEQSLLWPGKTSWFAKSSGTTSGKSKFIPVSMETLEECHYKAGKDLLTMYCHNNPNSQLFAGKSLIMGGSHQINELNENSKYGDVSAVMMQNMPMWTQLIRTPELRVALLDEWEEKLELMAQTTRNQNVTSISGVPTWTLVLLRQLLEMTQLNDITALWPNLELYIHGGVNFAPYAEQFKDLIPSKNMKYYQVYNASEGCFGVQMQNHQEDMLLMLDYGIFYEFIPKNTLHEEQPKTILLDETEVGEEYAVVISTNSGLWRYKIGDVVEVTSKYPFKIKVAGRTKAHINVFGEELMVGNTDQALKMTCAATNAAVKDYTAAPIFLSGNTKGAHEWLIEFHKEPENLALFKNLLDKNLQQLNSDYEAKRHKDIALECLHLHAVPKGTFHQWLQRKGKLGGQNKVPRLSNSRRHVEEILNFVSVSN